MKRKKVNNLRNTKGQQFANIQSHKVKKTNSQKTKRKSERQKIYVKTTKNLCQKDKKSLRRKDQKESLILWKLGSFALQCLLLDSSIRRLLWCHLGLWGWPNISTQTGSLCCKRTVQADSSEEHARPSSHLPVWNSNSWCPLHSGIYLHRRNWGKPCRYHCHYLAISGGRGQPWGFALHWGEPENKRPHRSIRRRHSWGGK